VVASLPLGKSLCSFATSFPPLPPPHLRADPVLFHLISFGPFFFFCQAAHPSGSPPDRERAFSYHSISFICRPLISSFTYRANRLFFFSSSSSAILQRTHLPLSFCKVSSTLLSSSEGYLFLQSFFPKALSSQRDSLPPRSSAHRPFYPLPL